MAVARRRTQAERRESTIARLIDSTISVLAESGYSQLTISAVCNQAALSQGALFRHFSSRLELIAAATEEVCQRHLALVATELANLRHRSDDELFETLVRSLRAAARTDEHAAWHEVMVAARSNQELHELVAPTLERFEQRLLAEISVLEGDRGSGRLGMVLLSIMHLMDSEAVTVAVYPNPRLEEERAAWLVDLLRRELAT